MYCTLHVESTVHFFLTFISQYPNISIVHIHHILRLVGYVESKSFSDHTMPRRTEFFIHCGFYQLRGGLARANQEEYLFE
jgi:hypothetical protein